MTDPSPDTPSVAERTHPSMDGRPVMIGDVLIATHPDASDPEGNVLEIEFHVGSMFWDSGHDVDYSTGKPVWPSRPRGWTVAPIEEEANYELPYEWPLSECRRPDTPSVCPTCGSPARSICNIVGPHEHGSRTTACCTDQWHATLPAPGSSSPDVAALAERLRDDGLQARHHDEVLTADDACRWGGVGALLWAEDMFKAADALEAQAARITELEQFLIRLGHNPDRLDLP